MPMIADVVAALTDDRPVGQLYELTGPRSRLLSFRDAVAEIGDGVQRALGREPKDFST